MIRSRVNSISMSTNSELMNKYHFYIEDSKGNKYASSENNDNVQVLDIGSTSVIANSKIVFEDNVFKYELFNNSFVITNKENGTQICNIKNVFDKKNELYIDLDLERKKQRFKSI